MDSIIHSQVSQIPHGATTTGFDLPGFRIVECFGVVRGVVVRSRSVFGTIGSQPADRAYGLREFVIRTPDGHRLMFAERLE